MTWWRFLLMLWTVIGLAVCAEDRPDVAGHSHAHTSSHPAEPWHGSPADRIPDDDNPKGPDFHYHVVMDFTAVDSDVPPALHARSQTMEEFLMRGVDEHPPEAPVLESEGPPLIRFRMA